MCGEYNAKYNYFNGMSDDAVAAFQKDAVVGHRPTWSMGVERGAQKAGARAGVGARLGILRSARRIALRRHPPAAQNRAGNRRAAGFSGPVMRALDVLGLDETADATTIRSDV